MPFIFLIVLILSVRGTLVRKFMLAAHDLEMTKGDWAFLDVEIFQVKISLFFSFSFFFLVKVYIVRFIWIKLN